MQYKAAAEHCGCGTKPLLGGFPVLPQYYCKHTDQQGCRLWQVGDTLFDHAHIVPPATTYNSLLRSCVADTHSSAYPDVLLLDNALPGSLDMPLQLVCKLSIVHFLSLLL